MVEFLKVAEIPNGKPIFMHCLAVGVYTESHPRWVCWSERLNFLCIYDFLGDAGSLIADESVEPSLYCTSQCMPICHVPQRFTSTSFLNVTYAKCTKNWNSKPCYKLTKM